MDDGSGSDSDSGSSSESGDESGSEMESLAVTVEFVCGSEGSG